MLEAAERTTDLSVQTDPVCLPSLPPFPSNSLPYRATNWPLWEPSTAPSTWTGLEPLLPQPPFLPKTPSAHIHLTLPLSVLTTYPPKTCFPCCLAIPWHAGLDCLIYCIIPLTDWQQPAEEVCRFFTPLFIISKSSTMKEYLITKSSVHNVKVKIIRKRYLTCKIITVQYRHFN